MGRYQPLDHLHRRNRRYFMPFGEQHNELPIGASPVIPHSANHALCCTNGSPVHQPLLQPAQSAYHTALAKLDEASQKWLEYTFLNDDTLGTITTLVESNTAMLVVDGSYLPGTNIATASWVMAGPTGTATAVGYSRLPDGNNDNDPNRAEIFGLCLALTFLHLLHRHDPTLHGKIVVSCDNDEALRHGIEYALWPQTQTSHFDLLATLHRLREKNSIFVKA